MRVREIVLGATWIVASGCAQSTERSSPSPQDAAPRAPFTNLGFEDAGDSHPGEPTSWDRHGAQVETDAGAPRTGKASLRITRAGEPGLSLASQCVATRELAGTRVTLSAHLKAFPSDQFSGDLQVSSSDPDGNARTSALSRTVDTEVGRDEAHPDRALVRAEDWTRQEVAVDVHDDPGGEVCISVIARGSGTLWADDLEVRASD